MPLFQNSLRPLIAVVTLTSFCTATNAQQQMKGRVVDVLTNKPIDNVIIENIHSGKVVVTDTSGQFAIDIRKEELVEFRKIGFRNVSIRVKETIPRFYNIQLAQAPIELDGAEIVGRNRNPTVDSLKKREIYGQVLDHYRLTGLDIIQHPIDALSKRNRQIWRFQDNYNKWESDKYVDWVFNEKLVRSISELGKDSINTYLRMYRPDYNQLRSWSEYQFYDYILKTVKEFRALSPEYYPVDVPPKIKYESSDTIK